MTVYNTAYKLATKQLERLEDLNIMQLESSLRQRTVRNRNNVTSRNVTGFNDFNLLGTKDLNKLINLLIQVIEWSNKKHKVSTSINVWSKDVTGFNSFDVLKDKDINRMTNLLIQVIEKSKENRMLKVKGLIIKPRKEYKATLRLYKSYNNNIRY